jgi:tetratricopeptide (TPR) repeat protein
MAIPMRRTSIFRTAALAAASATVLWSAGCGPRHNAPTAAPHDAGAVAAADDAPEPSITARTRFAAGQLAESQNNLPRAIEQYEYALRTDPDHQPSLYRLGVVYAQAKQHAKAIEAWKRYVKATGNSAAAYANLGFCHELAGQPQDAEAAYQRGIARDPRSEPCRVNYGLMLARLGRTSEAVIQLQAVLPPAAVQYNLASVHEQQGNREQAKAGYRKALELDPTFADARARLTALTAPAAAPGVTP